METVLKIEQYVFVLFLFRNFLTFCRMNALHCLFSARRRFLGNHIPAAIAVAAIATLFVYVWSKRKSEKGFRSAKLSL